nr:MAG TPA: hypothetical protein [Bacteriophage sp.]
MEKIESQISKDKSLVDRIRELSGVVILSKCEYERLVQKQASEDVVKTLQASINALTIQLNNCNGAADYWRNKYDECREQLKKETDKWWRF